MSGMEYDLANDKIKELEDETDEEQKIKALAKQMKEYQRKKLSILYLIFGTSYAIKFNLLISITSIDIRPLDKKFQSYLF